MTGLDDGQAGLHHRRAQRPIQQEHGLGCLAGSGHVGTSAWDPFRKNQPYNEDILVLLFALDGVS